MRWWWFVRGIGIQQAAQLLQVIKSLLQQLLVARSLGARSSESIAHFGKRLFLESESSFQFRESAIELELQGLILHRHGQAQAREMVRPRPIP